jgi:hypothetical protein
MRFGLKFRVSEIESFADIGSIVARVQSGSTKG